MALQIWLPLLGNLNNNGIKNATITSTGITADDNGKIGKCYSFPTLGNYISIPNDIITTSTTEFSLCYWVNLAQLSNNYAVLFSSRNATRGKGLTFWISSTGIRTDDGSQWNVTYDFPLNTWVHLCLTWSNIEEVKKFYVNGNLLSSKAFTSKNLSDLHSTIKIGEDTKTLSTYSFIGKMNDVRIYDHALSAREIKEISKGLTCHYTLSLSGENLLANSIPVEVSGWAAYGTGWTRTSVDATGSYNGKAIRSTYGGTDGGVRGGLYKTFSPGTGYFAEGDKYTITARIRASLNCTIRFYSSFSAAATQNITTEWATYTYTATITTPTANGRTYIVIEPSYVTNGVWIECCMIKMEKGNKSTPWIPYKTDDAYTALGFNDNIEYDVSGYGYNATKTDITYDSDTPRYNVSSVFNGTTSVIDAGKDFHVQGAKNMSMACWAYCEDWTTSNHKYLLSSQQTGGLALQYMSGTTMRARWHVYTAADLSTYAYNQADFAISLTSGWHHFCGTLDDSSIKLYIDGVPVQDKSIVNYGVHFNNTADMFIGAESAGDHASDLFNGKISDVRIYYTTLSASQVAELYNTAVSVANNGTLMGYELVEV